MKPPNRCEREGIVERPSRLHFCALNVKRKTLDVERHNHPSEGRVDRACQVQLCADFVPQAIFERQGRTKLYLATAGSAWGRGARRIRLGCNSDFD